MVTIKATTTLEMPFFYSTAEIVANADRLWLSKLDDKIRRLAIKLFEGSQIASRGSAFPFEIVFGDLSFQEKNDHYVEAMITQGKKLLTKFFNEHSIRPEEIDYLITTSCTGFMIPSVDAYLANYFSFKKNLLRLPVTEMGCAGGTAGLIYGHDFIVSKNNAKALIVSLEFPSITFQKNDLAPENLVSTAIFADGAACVLLENNIEKNQGLPSLNIKSHRMYHFPDATHLMGFNLINSGLKIVLHKDVPVAINDHFDHIMMPFLNDNNISIQDIDAFLFHPGGKKIVSQVQHYLAPWGKDIPLSRKVLTERGNMSSATVLHILDEYLKNCIQTSTYSERAMMMAFGPGFMAQQLLLEWNK